MYISWSVHLKENRLKLRYAYIIKCSSQGKLFKVALCIYIIKCSSQGKLFKVAVCVYIIKCSSQRKLLKVAVCIYHQVFISSKVV